MKTATLEDVTQEEFDAAAQTVISGVKAFNPKLDTRKGTVLRDLLVNPEAAIDSVTTKQIEYARDSSSLKRLEEYEAAGGHVDQDDVQAILSNFNITPPGGTRARGLVKMTVADGGMVYSIAAGTVFSTVDGIEFEVSDQVTASSTPGSNPGVVVTTPLYEGAAGYFFTIPVVAVEAGEAGNIEQGTALTPSSGMFSYVSAEAYKPFDGGSDVPDMNKVIASIPSGLSIRGFVNRIAVEGMLRSRFDAGNYPIMAVSAAGYGDGVQRRDKHNVFGVGVGGRVDVYVRNFTDMFTITKMVEGSKTGDGSYEMALSAEDFPGACWIKSVADPVNNVVSSGSSSSPEEPASGGDREDVLGSMQFTAQRVSDGVDATWHDIDVSKNPSEAFNTVWQGFRLSLTNVAPDTDESGWSDTRDFKVTAYCLPEIVEMQGYVDEAGVRSVSTDVVVRCPIICSVSVNAVVRYDVSNPIDAVSAASRIRAYINGLGFVGRLTRSEIVHILKDEGAVSVDMPRDDMLFGVYHDAFGVEHKIRGDALDIWSVQDDRAMVSPLTVVFAAEAKNIQIQLLPNE